MLTRKIMCLLQLKDKHDDTKNDTAIVVCQLRLQLILTTLVLNFIQVAHWQLHYQHYLARDNFPGLKMASSSWHQDNPFLMMLCYNLCPRNLRTGPFATAEGMKKTGTDERSCFDRACTDHLSTKENMSRGFKKLLKPLTETWQQNAVPNRKFVALTFIMAVSMAWCYVWKFLLFDFICWWCGQSCGLHIHHMRCSSIHTFTNLRLVGRDSWINCTVVCSHIVPCSLFGERYRIELPSWKSFRSDRAGPGKFSPLWLVEIATKDGIDTEDGMIEAVEVTGLTTHMRSGCQTTMSRSPQAMIILKTTPSSSLTPGMTGWSIPELAGLKIIMNSASSIKFDQRAVWKGSGDAAQLGFPPLSLCNYTLDDVEGSSWSRSKLTLEFLVLDGMGPQLMPCRILWPMLRDTSASNINLAIYSGHFPRISNRHGSYSGTLGHRKAFLKWDFAWPGGPKRSLKCLVCLRSNTVWIGNIPGLCNGREAAPQN